MAWPRTIKMVVTMMEEREVWVFQCLASVLYSVTMAAVLPISSIVAPLMMHAMLFHTPDLQSNHRQLRTNMSYLITFISAIMCICGSSLIMLPMAIYNCVLTSAVYPSSHSIESVVFGKRGVLALAGTSIVSACWGAATMTLYWTLKETLVLLLYSLQDYHDSTELKWIWTIYGVVLGALLCTMRRLYDKDVAVFPSIQRTRFTRLKQALVGEVITASKSSVTAAILTVFIFAFKSGTTKDFTQFTMQEIIILLLAGYSASYVFGFSSRIIQIIYTTRVRFITSISSKPKRQDVEPLTIALSMSQNTFLRSLATLELYSLTCSPGQESKLWRIRYIFGDETGKTWCQLALRCMDPIETVISELDLSDLVDRRMDHVLSKGLFTKRLQPNKTINNDMISTEQLKARACSVLKSRHQLCIWSCEILSTICTSSLMEDKYGILQLFQPTVGVILDRLLSLYDSTTEAFPLGSGSPEIDEIVDATRKSIYSLVLAFKGHFIKLPPISGTNTVERRDALLEAFKAWQV